MELQKKYVGAVNHILKGLDFRKLEKSCNSYEQTYAKEVLCKLHQAFVDTMVRTSCRIVKNPMSVCLRYCGERKVVT